MQTTKFCEVDDVSYSIIRVEKIKGAVNTTGIQKHVQRENNNYGNQDIQHELTHENYDLIRDDEKINFNEEIEKKIEENYTVNRAIRKDAVKHIDGIVTSDKEFFDGLTLEQTREYFEDSLEFIKDEYGEENILYATVHMDEATPHMHFGFVPITKDGRLSAKEMLGNKKAFTELQDRYNRFVNERGYKLERGESKHITGEKHKEVNAYKQKTKYHEKEMQEKLNEVEKLEIKKESIQKEIDEKISMSEAKLNDLRAEYEKLGEKYEIEKERLEKPLNVKYEKEIKTQGNLFSKEEVETGNVIVAESDFKEMVAQTESARNLLEKFDDLNNGTEIQELRAEVGRLNNILDSAIEDVSKFEKEIGHLAKENKILKNSNEKLKVQNKAQIDVIKGIRGAFNKTMKGLKEIVGDQKLSKMILAVDKLFKNKEFFRNLVVGFDKKYKDLFILKDKRNLIRKDVIFAKEFNFVDIKENVMRAQVIDDDGVEHIKDFQLTNEELVNLKNNPTRYSVFMFRESGKIVLADMNDLELPNEINYDVNFGLEGLEEVEEIFKGIDLQR